MKRKILLIAAVLLLISSFAFALDVPHYKGYVNDYTGTLTPPQIAELEGKIRQHEKGTSNQIAVLIIPSLEGENLEQFSLKVAEAWKVGQKKKNNGVLLLVAMKDRKLRIETGYGVEGPLPDSLCGTIIRQDITPKFKEGKHFLGIVAGVDKIILAIRGEYKAESSSGKSNDDGHTGMGLIFFAVLMLLAGIVGIAHWFFGGLVGGVGSFFLADALMGWPLPGIIIAVIIGFMIGAIAKFILEAMADGSGGGYGGGYSSSSSGSSDSGFSFGGGGFGGGGASGSW